MQYTSNFNLMLPEGTDTVNLLTQMNPNTSDIDAAMFANKQAVIGSATELTAGTVHAITRANTASNYFRFTATSNWTAGDTMEVDGVACSVFLSDGQTPQTGAYVINTEVLALLSGTRVTLLTSAKQILNPDASDVNYDNTGSGLTASDVQDAIDEVASEIDTLDNDVNGNQSFAADRQVVIPSGSTGDYEFGSDGYITITTGAAVGYIEGKIVDRVEVANRLAYFVMRTLNANQNSSNSMYVRKGMKVVIMTNTSNGSVIFAPLS